MKPKIHIKIALAMLFVIASNISNISAQILQPLREGTTQNRVKGDLVMAGNAIVGLREDNVGNTFNPNADYHGFLNNGNSISDYIDIDGDSNTFSSSSADITTGRAGCSRIIYAGLYWSAVYYLVRSNDPDFNNPAPNDINNFGNPQLTGLPPNDARKQGLADFRNVKFKVPFGNYVDVTAQDIIFDGYRNTATNPSNSASDDVPYVCYAEVTSLIDQSNTDGTYTVANMNATIGHTSGFDGTTGGWVLVVIYEDQVESSKFISTNHGFVQINNGDAPVDFTYTGFTSLPGTLPVEVSYGVAALEGDRGLGNDRLRIRNRFGSFVSLGSGVNPTNNFFNSSISISDPNPPNASIYTTDRNPASRNTLGFDIDLFDLPNTGNNLIGNNQSNATFRLETDQDTYRVFLNSFAIEIIEPELRILKRVFDTDGTTEITNGNVELGDELFYDLEIENVGNEDLEDDTSIPSRPITITDILPDNVDLVSIGTLPPGVTYTITPPSRIDFNIPASIVEENDAPIFIRFRVRLVSSCEELRDACSNTIQNSALATFTGAISGETLTNNSSSIIGACGNTDGEATNFLVNVPSCSNDVTFCNADLQLVAGTGYDLYTWSGPGIPGTYVETPSDNILDFTTTPFTAQSGTYTVVKEDTNPADGTCMTLTEEFVVDLFSNITNPIESYINGTTVIETNCSGLRIPQILLCGSQTFDLATNFDPATLNNISWQQLTPSGSCVLDSNDPCSLLSGNCTDTHWIELPGGNTSSYTVSDAGDYRILAEFDGGCFIPFFFSVFKNDYQPTLDMTPIECGNDGSVSVTNAPTNFEFSLTSGGPYLPATVFPITPGNGGDITVYGIDRTFPGCEYTATINVPEINPIFSVTSTNPTCINDTNGTGTGTIQIQVTNGSPEYQYTISGGTLTTPIIIPNSSANNGNYIQSNLNPGTYDVEVISNRPSPECIFNQQVIITPAADFRVEAILLAPETCDSGALVQVNVLAGSGNHLYDIGIETAPGSGIFNPSGNFTACNIFELPTPANPATSYTFYVSDESINTPPAGIPACIVEANITGITPYEPIVIDNVTTVQPPCFGDDGQIIVDVLPVVAGRNYTYQLWDCAGDPNCGNSTTWDPALWTLVTDITTTNNQATFSGVADGNSYAIAVVHDSTTPAIVNPNCTITAPPALVCPVRESVFSITTPDEITADVSTDRELSCLPAPNNDALILVENIQGGSNPGNYEWSFNATSGFVNVPSDPFTIPVTTNGSYTIYIRNQGTNDCAEDFTTPVAPLVTVDDITFSIPGATNCVTQSYNIIATAQPPGPAYTYNVTPAPISSGPGAGEYRFRRGVVYTVTATNPTNGCTYSEDFTEASLPEIQITSAIETQAVRCVGENNGELAFTVTNSTAFDYEVRDVSNTVIAAGPAAGVDPITVTVGTLIAGTYTINITDTSLTPPAANCTDTATVVITEPTTPLSITNITTENSDCVNNTGTITVTATGGRGNHQYELRDAANVVVVGYPNTNNVFTGLTAGNYTVFVRDGNSAAACEIFQAVTVIQSTAPTISAVPGGDQCFDATPATQWITITPSPTTTAVGPFEYTLTGPVSASNVPVVFIPPAPPSTTFEIPNLTPGAYTVTVTNTDTNCTSLVVPFTINPELTITASLTKEIDCNSGATITFTPAGGSLTYTQFDLYNPGTPPTLVQANLPTPPFTHITTTPGDYLIGVVDDAGCTAFSNTITVTPYTALAATITGTTDPACPGESTGSIEVTVTAGTGTGPYTYVLDGNLATQIGPTGAGPVTFNNVAAGAHTVTVTDGSGAAPACTVDVNTTLTDPTPITATITNTRDLSCTATPDAQVDVTIAGGSGSYEWSLDGTNFTAAGTTTFTIDFATAGPYTISIRNAATDDCLVPFPITIDPLLVVDSVVVTPVANTLDCTNQTIDVVVSATPVGPPPTYQYSITPDPATGAAATGTTPFSATTNYTFTNGVTYRVTARRDDSQCTNFIDFNQPLLDEIQITNAAQTQPVTCITGADGEFSFTVGNSAAFTYTITGGTTVVPPGAGVGGTPVVIGSVEAGIYTITVTDSFLAGGSPPNCQATTTVTITEPANPITFNHNVDQTCNNNVVSVNTVAGGNGPVYEYELFDSGDVSQGAARPIVQTYDNVPNGTGYYIIVRDSQGCESARVTFDINALPAVALTVTGSELCLDDNIATIDIDITNGTPDYSYDITRDGTQIVGVTPLGVGIISFTTPNLTQSGTYVITVTDSVGCTEQVTQVIEPAVELIVTPVADLSCDALGNPVDAEFSFVVNGGYTPFDIDVSIDGAAAVNHLTNAVAPFTNYTTSIAGSYVFIVTDDRGCSFTTNPFIVTDAVAPTITAPTVNLDCDGDTGTAVVNVTGTETPYEIDFQNTGTFVAITGTQITFPNLGEAVYPFTVRSGRGCLYPDTVEITTPDPITEVSRTETPVTCGGSAVVTDLGAIDFEIAGGTATYTYTLVDAADFAVRPLVPSTTAVSTPNPITTGTTVRFEGLDFGQYFIFITDANGCTDNAPFGPFNIFSRINDVVQSVTPSATCPGGVTFDIVVQGGSGIIPPANPPPGFDIRIVGEPSPGLGDFVALNDDPLNATLVDANTPIRIHQYTGLDFNRTYILEVRDNATNCLYQELVPPVNPPSAPNIINDVVTNVTCNPSPDDGTVSFDINGYDATVTEVSWEVFNSFTNVTLGVAYSGSAAGLVGADVPVVINNLPPGEYYVTILEVDGTLCPARYDFTIDLPDPLTSVATNQTPANSCGTNAQVIMDTSGGVPFAIPPTADGYQYAVVATGAGDPGVYPLNSNVIDLGSTVQTLDIWVNDSNANCSFGPVTVTTVVNPLPTVTAPPFVVDPCTYDNDYTFQVVGTGLGTLTYQLNGGTAVTGSINNFNHVFTVTSAGIYTITITDDTGCTNTDTIEVFDPLDISATFTTAPDCTNPTGVITTTVTGTVAGTVTFELQDSTGTPTGIVTGDVNGIYTNVPPGDYIVQVTDDGRGPNAGDCPFTTPVSIQAPPQPTIDGAAGVTNMTCNSDAPPTGSITVSLIGALDPAVTYEYEITTAPGTGDTRPRQSSPTFNNLDVDTYTVRVWATLTNGSGGSALDVVCFDDQIFNITEPVVVDATVNQGDQFDCDGNTNATIEITAVVGGSGTGYIAEVTRPDAVVLSNIAITAPTTSIEAPIPGAYTVQIFDSNNCPSAIFNVNIAPYTPMFNPLVTQTQAISCLTPPPAGAGDEIVEVSIQGGSGDFIFEQIDNVGGVIAAIDTPIGTSLAQFFNLPAVGTYTFRITDQGDVNGLGLNCDITVTYDVPEFDLIEATAVVTPGTTLLCAGDLTGSIDVTVVNYNGEYNYIVRNTVTAAPELTGTVLAGFTNPQTITGVLPAGIPAGIFVVEIEAVDAPNCDTVTNAVTITEPEPLLLALDSNINANCNEGARVTVTATGGTGVYTYTADDNGVAPFLFTNNTGEFILPAVVAGTPYIINVTDANNCTTTPLNVTAFLTNAPVVNPLTFVDDPCVYDNSYEIRVTGTSNVASPPGTGDLTFQLDTDVAVAGNVSGTEHIFTVTSPGTYTVRVFDENGCVSNDEQITVFPQLSVSADFTIDPNCRDIDGTITATPVGGSDFTLNPGNFTFTLIENGTNIVIFVPQASNVFFPVAAGDYRVEVTDTGSGCTKSGDIPPLTVPVDPVLSETHTGVSCVGSSDGEVTISIQAGTDLDGPYTYQLFENNGGGIPVLPPPPAQQIGADQIDNPTFTGLSFDALPAPYPTAGEYLVLVTSDRGCFSAIEVVIPNASQVTATSSQTPYTCTGTTENFPEITVTILDGTPPYSITYTSPLGTVVTDLNITDADGVTPGVQYIFTGDEVGNYVITVTDSNGCNIPTPPGPTITETILPLPIMTNPTVTQVTPISCVVGEDVTVSVTGGTGPFDFEVISGPVVVAPQLGQALGTANFTLSDVGTYVFRITDQTTTCFIETSYTIDPFDLIDIVATEQTPESCFGNADGTIQIAVSQYVGDFGYTIVDVATGLTVFTSLADLTTDADPLTADLFTIPTPPTGLGVGNYRVDITETNAPNCPGSSNVVVISGPSIPLVTTITPINSQESCDPGSDISFQATVTGDRGTVTYLLVETGDTNTTGLFENLPVGTGSYTVTATDTFGAIVCTDDETIIVTPPTDDVAITPIPPSSISCFGETDGTITVTATATDVPLRYSITPLPAPPGIESVLQTGNVFDNLAPGDYTITVYDQLGCTAQVNAVINDVPEVTVAINVDRVVSCGDDTVDVTVTGVSSVGPIAQFVMVNVTNPATPVETPQVTGTFLGIGQGEYVFYVVDANGCRSQNSDPVPVVPINPINFDLDTSAANVNCRDEATGVIDIDNLTGGIGDYEFYLLNGAVALPIPGVPPSIYAGPQVTTVFRDLAPGTYTYLARSATDTSCAFVETFTIDNPLLFLPTIAFTDVTCNGEDDGTITITIDLANPGTASYSYAIDSQPGVFFNDASDGVPNMHVFENLAPGTYEVLAQDANGCDYTETFTISEPVTLQASVVGNITPETCFEASDGAVTITVTGGTAPYETNITNNDGDFVQDMFTYTGLPGGTTTIFIRDANNCRIELPVVIPEGVMLGAILEARIDCPVRDENDASVIIQGPRYFVDFAFTPTSVSTDIIYTLTGVNGTSDPTPNTNLTGEFEVSPGEYQGTMEHVGGCIVNVGNITIEEYIPLSVPVAQMTNNPQDPNEYEIIVSGGRQFENSPFYSFSFTKLEDGETIERLESSDFTELDGNIFVIRETANYAIRVVDANGCEVIVVQNLTYINIRIPNYFTPDSPNSSTDERFWYPRQITPNIDDPFFFENMEVMVFDRYGRMLAEFKGDQQGWDGLYQGKQLPSGDYWYTIILNDVDNREFTGHFTLYR